MKKNSISPLAVIVTVLTAIVALVIAFVIKNCVFDGLTTELSDLLFWLVFSGIAGGGTVLANYLLSKNGKGGRRKW